MYLAFFLRNWQLLLSLIVIIILVFLLSKEKTLSSYYQNRYEKSEKEYRQYVDTQTQAYLKAEELNKELESKYQNVIKEQEENNEKAIKEIQNSRAKSNSIINGLHKTVATYQSQLSTYPLTTQVKYSITYSGLFQECSTRLAEVAEQGDRESVDKMTLYNSWMNMIKSQNQNALKSEATK